VIDASVTGVSENSATIAAWIAAVGSVAAPAIAAVGWQRRGAYSASWKRVAAVAAPRPWCGRIDLPLRSGEAPLSFVF